jgi:hypothetical protein
MSRDSLRIVRSLDFARTDGCMCKYHRKFLLCACVIVAVHSVACRVHKRTMVVSKCCVLRCSQHLDEECIDCHAILIPSIRSASALSVWSVIVQQLPTYESPPLSAEPGTSGRILRVTIGVATFFFASYYQTMQLSSLLTSSSSPIEYTLHMLADDLRSGHVRELILRTTNGPIDKEFRNNNNTRPGGRRLLIARSRIYRSSTGLLKEHLPLKTIHAKTRF